MSEKPAIYRLHGSKVLCASFPRPPLKLDGDIAPYVVSNECAQNVGTSAQLTDETDSRKPDSGKLSEKS